MRNLLFAAVMLMSAVAYGQPDTLQLVGGGLSGGDSRKVAYEKINDNDIWLSDSIDAVGSIGSDNADSIAVHLGRLDNGVDSLAAHDTKINTNIQSAADNADSVAVHLGRLDEGVDSLAVHLGRLDDGVDSTAVHDGKINTNISDIETNTDKLVLFDTAYVALSADSATIPIMVGNTRSLGMFRQANIWHMFGGFEDSAAVISITEDQYSMVTNVAGDLWKGIEVDGFSMSGDTMTIDNAGDYIGSVSITFTCTNSNVCRFHVYNVTDAAEEGFAVGATGDGASDYVTVTKPLYFENVSAGDEFVLRCTNVDASNDITVRFGAYFLTYLHD